MPTIFQIKNPKTGQIIRKWELLDKQSQFIFSDKRYALFSGGFGGGKTLALILKALYLLKKHPGNVGIMGRMHYQDLRDTLLKDFLKICPKIWMRNYVKSEKKMILYNGSELLFRHLDKIAEKEIRSLNLGFFAIDQAEQIIEPVYMALKGRLRRENTSQQGFMTANPANTWLFREFKQEAKEENELVEISTLENRYLPPQYVEDLMRYPDSWKQQFVYGIWDTALIGDRNIYSKEILDYQRGFLIPPEKADKYDDIRLYFIPDKDDFLQMGVDTSEGIGGDAAVLSVISTKTGREVAFWMGQLPPDVLANKALGLINHLNTFTGRRMMVIPEINGMGIAFLNQLKKNYQSIYARDVFVKRIKEKKQVLGWKTNMATKPLLIDNHVNFLRKQKLIIHTPELLEQLKTFVYTDEVNKQGMGADPGFHDDAVIGHALASFFDNPTKLRLMSTEKFKNPFVKEAYNPLGEDIHSMFDRHYDWLTDTKQYD